MVEGGHTMGITLNITVSTPLSEEDDNILAGTAYWLMATANRNAVQPPSDGSDPFEDDEERSCGKLNAETDVCIRDHGHSGRRRHRPLTFEGPLN
jgi:hypothetical protein